MKRRRRLPHVLQPIPGEGINDRDRAADLLGDEFGAAPIKLRLDKDDFDALGLCLSDEGGKGFGVGFFGPLLNRDLFESIVVGEVAPRRMENKEFSSSLSL